MRRRFRGKHFPGSCCVQWPSRRRRRARQNPLAKPRVLGQPIRDHKGPSILLATVKEPAALRVGDIINCREQRCVIRRPRMDEQMHLHPASRDDLARFEGLDTVVAAKLE
jgi:hypothetical protein